MKNALLILIISTVFTSCSPKIVGNWNVDRYEIDNYLGKNLTARNAGEITLNKNGTGEKNLSIQMFNEDPNQPDRFRWELKNQILRIYDDNSKQPTDFAKSWIIVTNRNTKQVWKSTDGSNSIQVIELSKN